MSAAAHLGGASFATVALLPAGRSIRRDRTHRVVATTAFLAAAVGAAWSGTTAGIVVALAAVAFFGSFQVARSWAGACQRLLFLSIAGWIYLNA